MSDRWSLASVPKIEGKVAVVTGANSGIGLETARGLAHRGATTVLACRDPKRGDAACDSIRAEAPNALVETRRLDLASLESVAQFSEGFLSAFDRLDLLVCNAGVMVVPYGTTEDGFEMHFGVNHLGHFALTGQLIGLLLATGGSRVVAVTSAAYRFGHLDFGNLLFESGRGYAPFRAYVRSKLANLLFTQELHRRLVGKGAISVAAHPGGVATGLGRRMTERRVYRRLLPLLELLSQSAAEGAQSVLRAATDPEASGGELFAPGGFLGMRGAPRAVGWVRDVLDEKQPRRLWEISEALTGVRFTGLPGARSASGGMTRAPR